MAYAIYYVGRSNYAVAKTSLTDAFGFDNVALGRIDTVYLIAYAIGQFLSGALGDRLGGKRLVGLGLIAVGVCNLAFGAGQGLLFFVVAWGANGLAQSSGWPGCAKAFSDWFARKERGTMMGIWCTCYQVGPIIGTFIATWLVVRFGWRAGYIGPALLVAGFGVLVLAFQKRRPEDEGLPPVEDYYAELKGLPPAPEEERAQSATSIADVLEVLKSLSLWTLGCTYVVLKFTRYSFLLWLPTYMEQALGYARDEAGYTSIIFGAAGIAGPVVGGVVSDRGFGGRRAPIVVITLFALAGATFAYGGLSQMGRAWNIIGLSLVGFSLYCPDAIVSGVAAVDFGERKAASFAAGFVNGLGSIGAALSGVVVGYVSAQYGWGAVFKMFPPLCVLAALLMTSMWNKTPKG